MTEAEKMAEEVTLEILKMTSIAEKQFWPVNIINLLSWKGSGLIAKVAERTAEEIFKKEVTIEKKYFISNRHIERVVFSEDIRAAVKWGDEEVLINKEKI